VQVFLDSPDFLLASFISGSQPGRLILISGPSGSGKTCWCMSLVERARCSNIQVAGLVSPAVMHGNVKIGIDLVDLQNNVRRNLAVRRGKEDGGKTTDDWLFDDSTLEWANALLARSYECPLFILDELGPLELERGIGLTNGMKLMAGRAYRLACAVVRPSLLEKARALWPWAEILRVDITHTLNPETAA
jgi:hypothetical protein